MEDGSFDETILGSTLGTDDGPMLGILPGSKLGTNLGDAISLGIVLNSIVGTELAGIEGIDEGKRDGILLRAAL